MRTTTPRVDAADIAHFRAFGFVHLRGWLTAEEVATLRAEAEEALLDGEAYANDVGGVPLRAHHVPLMAATTPFSMSLLIDDPRFLDAATALLGRPAIPMQTKAARHVGDTGWHTDWPTVRPLTRLGFGHYFEPLTASTGALRFLPATHQLPSFDAFDRYIEDHCPNSPEAIDHIGSQAVETQPGDIIAMDGRILHASRGGRARLRWNLGYWIEPATPEELSAHRDGLAEYRYSFYTEWAANRHHHPDRAAMIARMEKLDLLRIPTP